MSALLYTVMNGAERIWQGQQIHANNLANVTTPGFRADLEWVRSEKVPGYGYDIGHRPVLEATGVRTREGPLIETGRNLDVAIEGPGYLTVLCEGGEAYTRAGGLSVDAEGILHIQGWPVLGEQGSMIVLPPFTHVDIGQDGTISILAEGESEMQAVDRLKLVDLEPAGIAKNEAGFIVTRSGFPAEISEAITLRTGHLEGSNVSAIDEMLKIMNQGREFEMQMRFFKVADEITASGDRLIRGG